MPTRHLTDDQRRSFAGDPAPEPLARFFGLDGTGRYLIGERRGEHNRLGFAAMLTGLRFLGAFPGAADDMPRSVLETLREPLGLGRAASLDGRFEGRSRIRHPAAIRDRFGFTDFGDDARARFRPTRWLHAARAGAARIGPDR